MPRARRLIRPGAVYHFIARFVASEWFIRGDEERRRYLNVLGRYISASDWRCFSFAIMSNHIHLGLLAGVESLTSWIRPIHSEFGEWINLRRERIGAVFVRGPKMLTVNDGGVARLIGYIHRNPVRAGVIAHPRDNDWTSHQAYAGLARRPSWLDVALGVQLAGFQSQSELDSWVDNKSLDLREPQKPAGRPKNAIEPSISLLADLKSQLRR